MAQKDDLKAQLDAAGIKYDPAASVAELKALLPVDDEVDAAPVVATYDFAVNVVKLNRAKVWVAEQAKLVGAAPAPVGAALIAAVKDRYVAIGGLLRDLQLVGKTKKRGSKVVNLADNDEEDK